VRSRDEIGQLGAEFNKMASSLQNQILEREKAEKARLIAEEEALSAKLAKVMMDNMIDPVIMLNLEGKISQYNQALTKRFNYGDEILAESPALLVIDDANLKVGKVIQEVIERGSVDNIELICLTKDKKPFPVLFSAAVVRNSEGATNGIVGVIRDITARKKNEDDLKEAKEYAENLIDTANAMVVVLDLKGNVAVFNRAAEEITGYSKTELENRNWFEVIVPKLRYPEVWKIFNQLTAHGLPRNFENPILTKNGEERYVVWQNSELQVNGQATGSISFGIDITERKRAEEVLAEKSDALARSNAELEQFAYVASHDLQEPLRMVASYVQLLQRRYEGKLDKNADEFINYAVDGAKRMGVMIDDLLQFSRVGTRGKPFQITDCESVFEKVINNLQIIIAESGSKITHDPLPKVYGDDVQLTQLFQNLIVNALKFHGDNIPEVHVTARKKGLEWIFSVRDNGIGIDPQYFDRVFIIFQRLHNKSEYPGSGIGLAICKKIVERHGGKIWIESELGKGSTFYFSIPAKGEKTND
jgi:PAS domain S-box-containing protein